MYLRYNIDHLRHSIHWNLPSHPKVIQLRPVAGHIQQTISSSNDMSNNGDDTKEALTRSTRDPFTWPTLKSIVLSPNTDDLSKLARSHDQQQFYRKCRSDIQNEWESIYDYLLCTKFGFAWEWCDSMSFNEKEPNENNYLQRRKKSKPTFEQWQSSSSLSLVANGDKSSGIDENESTISAVDATNNAQTKTLVLSPNDFPYYFSTGIDHWVLWKLGGTVTHDEIANAKLDILHDHRQSIPTDSTAMGVLDPSSKVSSSQSCNNLANGESVFDDTSLFLHWINPPHLKSLPGIDHVHILFHRAELSH